MKLLSLDLSSATTGWAYFTNQNLDSYGSISFKKYDKDKKILYFANEIEKLIDKINPDHITIEDIFVGKNILSFKTLSELRGVARFLIEKKEIPYTFFSAVQVRKKIGCGKSKQEAFDWLMNNKKWNMSYSKHNDQTDAILLGMSFYIEGV